MAHVDDARDGGGTARPPGPPPESVVEKKSTPERLDLTGPLRPGELAEAAVLADLAVLIVIFARLTPFSGLTVVVGAIPFAVLGLRHRRRVVVVAFWIGAILTFLMAGFAAASQVLVMATFGAIVGKGARFGWSRTTTITMTLLLGWTTVAIISVGYLFVFAELRQLSIDTALVQWTGLRRFLDGAQLGAVGEFFDPPIQWALDHWYVAIPAFQLLISVPVAALTIQFGGPAIRRVDAAFGPLILREPEPSDGPVRPLPLSIEGAVVHRGTTVIPLPDVELGKPEFVVVSGPNGAGKSTMLGALSGRLRLAAGTRRTAGPIGLGRPGGTAVIGQRPESQVVGARVSDDLAWGLPTPPSPEDMAAVLRDVDLVGFEARETAGLSGGELQRLAIAAALLRSPRLLLSDESTAMLDPEARTHVLSVLRRIAENATVVHVTHLEAERRDADRVINVGDGST